MSDAITKKALPKAVELFCKLFAEDPAHDPARAYDASGLPRHQKESPLIKAEELLSKPEVANRIRELAHEIIPALDFVESMRNRAMCLDLWRNVIRGSEYDGEPIPLKLKLEASALLAKSCGLTERKDSVKAAVNVNVGPSSQHPNIQICDPYAVPAGDGKTVDVMPIRGFGEGPDAN